MPKVNPDSKSKLKHIIVTAELHKQLLDIKPQGLQFNYLIQFLMLEAGYLDKNDPELIYKYLRKKMKGIGKINKL